MTLNPVNVNICRYMVEKNDPFPSWSGTTLLSRTGGMAEEAVLQTVFSIMP